MSKTWHLLRLWFSLCFLAYLGGSQRIYALSEPDLATDQGRDTIKKTMDLGFQGHFISRHPGPSGQEVKISYFALGSKDQRPQSPAIVIFPGYSEPWLKYDEIIHDLWEQGFQLWIMDHRGMGLSTHVAGRLAHVDSIEHYADDARQFLESFVFPRVEGPIHLLGHSLGGLVVTRTVGGLSQPERINSLGLNAPLFEIESGSIPDSLVSLVAFLQNFLGLGEQMIWGRGRYDPKKDRAEDCSTTHSRVRCQRAIDLLVQNDELLIEAPSASWVQAVLKATREKERFVKDLSRYPVVITQAGIDHYVRPKPQEQVCAKLPNCQLEKFAEGKHELLQEKDAIRDQVTGVFVGFFKKYSTTLPSSRPL